LRKQMTQLTVCIVRCIADRRMKRTRTSSLGDKIEAMKL